MSVENIDIDVEVVRLEPRRLVCPTCGKNDGVFFLASKMFPEWLPKLDWLYPIWQFVEYRIFGNRLGGSFHEGCIPEGFKFWSVEKTPDFRSFVIVSEGVRNDLIKAWKEDLTARGRMAEAQGSDP